ncbi:MAG: Gfo/Idh/MocA family oxidoreductase [Balneolaceae bacterium]
MKKNNKKNPADISRRKFLGNLAAAGIGISIVPRNVLGGPGFTAPSDQITLGYIGNGRQAMGGLSSWFLEREDVKIVAGCDVDRIKLDRFVNKVNRAYSEQSGNNLYESCKGYKDFRKLLYRKDIDAVVIATPDHWHGIISVLALKSGKDVYCEKPLSLTIEEGRAMVKATRDHERVFQTGSMQRSWEDFHRACELVINGYIGRVEKVIVSVEGPPEQCSFPAQRIPEHLDWNMWLGPAEKTPYNEYYAPPADWDGWARWRYCEKFGGGGMTDWGAHMFDIAQWALGMDHTGPIEVIPPDGNEYPVLSYKYANGTEMVRDDFGEGNAVRFIGTEGTIDVSRSFLRVPESLENQPIGSDDIRLYKSDHHYLDWLNAIRDRTRPICDVEIGHRTATVCSIGNIAYKLNRPLQWNPALERFENDREANNLLSRPFRFPWNGII